MTRKVAVLGGGHGAQTLAADLTLRGHQVRLFEVDEFANSLAPVFSSGRIEARGEVVSGTAELDLVTGDIDAALDDADAVLIAVPAFAHRRYAGLLRPRLKSGQLVVLLPGTFGTLEMAHAWGEQGTDTGVVLAETDTLPYATRALRPGVVHAYGRTTVQLGVFPAHHTDWATSVLGELLPVEAARNVLEIGLSNTNPVLHPPGTILNTGRIERSRGEFYIYEEGMTRSVVAVIDALDAERRALGATFGLELPTIAEALNSAGYGPAGNTWEVLNGSSNLTPIKGPTSLDTRYLCEDIPYGLTAWSQLATQVGVETPLMSALVAVGNSLLGQGPGAPARDLESLGLRGLDADAIVDYVTRGWRAPHLGAETTGTDVSKGGNAS